ncbi:MAG: T9SS type A sorting domain-containing protein [Bacteroidetes bacterium]|nr:T9SS type A sorting domain-containing protein [Bacteroidota bacterium]
MKKYFLFSSASLFVFSVTGFAQIMGGWLPKADFPTNGRSAAVGFNVGTAAYVCTGVDSGGYKRSTYLFNPAVNTWTQVASLGGVTGSGLGRDVAMSFAIGTNAYVVGGQGTISYMSDTWKYDAVGDVWTQVQAFNGGGRRAAVGITINGKGYIICGQASTGLKNDTWEYNPTNNLWVQKALYPGTARRLAVGFVINNIGYVGTGDDGIAKGDFFAFDPTANSWTPKAPFPGTPRYGSVGFALNNKGYVGFGYDNTLNNRKDFFEYDPTSNTWLPMHDFPGTARSNSVAVSCPNNKAYVGLGYDSLYRTDWWEFDPLSTGINENVIPENAVNIFPNPMTDAATISIDAQYLNSATQICIYDLNGKMVRELSTKNNSQLKITREDLSPGIYLLNVRSQNKQVTKKLIVE